MTATLRNVHSLWRAGAGLQRLCALTCQAVGLALCLALLSACGGPGVGGTGTGATPEPLATFGASATPLCGSTLAGRLRSPSGAASAPLSAGTAPVAFADATAPPPAVPVPAAPAVLRFEGNGIDFRLPCQGLRFSGLWGTVPGQAPRFYGLLTASTSATPVLATVTVLVVGDSVVLLVQDAQGVVINGPRAFAPMVGIEPPPAVCPPA
jgi:hypothetical protein